MEILSFLVCVPFIIFFGVLFLVIAVGRQIHAKKYGIRTIYFSLGFATAVLCSFVAFLAVYALSFWLHDNSKAAAVQAALDEQCGKGKYIADIEGLSSENPTWSGYDGEVYCFMLHSGEEWTCRCPSPTDEKP